MLQVSIVFAALDSAVAEGLAARIERCNEARVELGPLLTGGTVLEVWESASTADALILLLSPESVPEAGGRALWGDLLEHVEHGAAPPVACIVTAPCRYPPLLERKTRFWRWQPERAIAIKRELSRWITGLHADDDSSAFVPAPARGGAVECDWESLFGELVDGPGEATVEGPERVRVAAELVRRAGEYFRGVHWLLPWMRLTATESRVLIVAEGVEAAGASQASVLRLAPDYGTPARAGDGDGLPEKTKDLWEALSACASPAPPLGLAGRFADLSELPALMESGFVQRFDAGGERVRLVRRAALDPGHEMRRRHAEAVAEVWALWRRMPAECEVWEQEWGDAFEFAVQHDWALAKRLGYPAGSRLRCQRREPEAAEVYARMHHEARERWRDAAAAEECCRELEWLRDDLASARQWAEAGPEQMALPFGAAGSG